MILFSAFFIIIGILEFMTIFGRRVKRDIIVYCSLMIFTFLFACFYFIDPFRESLVSLLLNL